MKITFIVSQVLLFINIIILVVIPPMFLHIFELFPNLDSSENGLGAFPLVCMMYGVLGLPITGAFAVVMTFFYIRYSIKKIIMNHKRN